MDIGEQIQLFQDFFELNYYDDIIKAVQKGTKHIDVDFALLSMFHIDLAQELLDNPEDVYKTSQLAVEKLHLQGDTKNFFVRFMNLPDSQTISIRDIRSKHLGKLIQVEGVRKSVV